MLRESASPAASRQAFAGTASSGGPIAAVDYAQRRRATPAEGLAFSGAVATFTASDAGPFNATIDWGDGSTSDGSISANGNVYTVAGSHTYAEEGSDAVSVAIIDAADSTTATITSTAALGESDVLTPSAGQYTVTGTEGVSVSGNVALFADSGYPTNAAADFTSTIDWGDGTTSAGTVSGPAATSLDMYSQPGDYIGGGATYHFTPATGIFYVDSYNASDSQIAFAYGSPNADQRWKITFAAPNGAQLVPGVYDNAVDVLYPHSPDQPGLDVSGDNRSSNSLTGGFTITQAVYDASGHVLSFDATFVQHSDGATPALTGEIKFNASGGAYTVSGSHAYADDGSYKITTILADDAPGTASASATATANIASALTLSPAAAAFDATEGTTATPVLALIADPGSTDPASEFLATIYWGDGTTSAGTITGAMGAYTVAGSHAYADEGYFTVSVAASEASAACAPPVRVAPRPSRQWGSAGRDRGGNRRD